MVPGRSLTTLLDNRPTSETSEDTRRQLRRSLECLVGVHFTEGNAITVLRNGDEIFPAMRVRVLIDALGGMQIEDGIVEAMQGSGVDCTGTASPGGTRP